jgi:lysophospholipase L1-like esterase
MVSTGGADPVGKTLYAATQIVSVRHSSLELEYVQGSDWTYNAGTRTLTAPSGSRIPSRTAASLSPFLLDESHNYHRDQIAVTYAHSGTWTGPSTSPSSKLTTVRGKLASGAAVKIAFFGDSIALGWSTSGFPVPGVSPIQAAPYLRTWPEQILSALRRRYPTATITWINPSLGGQTAAWGAANAASLVAPFAPDLSIQAFGMNDLATGVTAATYGSNMATSVANDGATEHIVVNTMHPNPAAFPGAPALQAGYLSQLTTIAAGSGIALADLGTVHDTLVTAKKFEDLTANGTSHPSDFLARMYAQQICGLLDALP